jgi:hypothetical protein
MMVFSLTHSSRTVTEITLVVWKSLVKALFFFVPIKRTAAAEGTVIGDLRD